MKKILLVLLVSSLVSCKSKETVLDHIDSEYGISSLFKPLNVNEDSLGRPEFILSIEDYIIIGDNNKEDLLVAYNLKDSTSKILLSKGNGAGEILNICYLNKSGNDSEFYVYDDFKKKIIYFNIKDNNINILKMEVMKDYSAFILSKDYIIGSRKGSDYRYTMCKRNDSSLYEIGNYSEFNITVSIGADVLYGFITNNDKIKRFAWVSLYAESINIIDYNNELKEVCNNIYKYPKYSKIRENETEIPVFSNLNTIGFTTVCSTDNLIFALYNGKSFKDSIKNPNKDILLCNNICVFDWDAKLIMNLYSDNGIKCIDYNRERNKLVFIILSNNDMYQIMEIGLQELNNKTKL